MSSSSAEYPVLSHLLCSNEQWAKNILKVDPTFFINSAKSQAPKILWIGCADSRVPESVIMACQPGEIFVHRNIANQFHPGDDNALSVLAYAVEHLGIQHVVVAGHTSCGGALSAFEASKANHPACATPLERWLAPLTKLVTSLHLGSKGAAEAVPLIVEASVKAQVANIVKTDTICKAWDAGKPVHVHGWVYLVEKGTLKDLHISQSKRCVSK